MAIIVVPGMSRVLIQIILSVSSTFSEKSKRYVTDPGIVSAVILTYK